MKKQYEIKKLPVVLMEVLKTEALIFLEQKTILKNAVRDKAAYLYCFQKEQKALGYLILIDDLDFVIDESQEKLFYLENLTDAKDFFDNELKEESNN